MEDKEDVICLYINIPGQYQAGEADEESINECVDYVCGVIDEFPNLQMFRIVNAPSAYSAMDQITNRVIERFEDRVLYEGYLFRISNKTINDKDYVVVRSDELCVLRESIFH
ncbi:MAG: hypothetical protein K6F79_06035 [Saccharofermentans sp.]|nr:hypothetical protein [Saccharofermentans sp.]